jgi:thiamine-phosphate pyrophosphorylase
MLRVDFGNQRIAVPAIAVIRDFYAVLDANDERLANLLVSGSGARAGVMQLRIKPSDSSAALPAHSLLDVALMARRVTRQHDAALIINDDLQLALAVDADGVHLGQDDMPILHARALIAAYFSDRSGPRSPGSAGSLQVASPGLWIGVSTHNDAQVERAITQGADYIGFGPVFATATKHNPDPVVGIDGLRRACQLASQHGVPVVAIGGIQATDVAAVYAAGADAICAISAVNQAADPITAGRAMSVR